MIIGIRKHVDFPHDHSKDVFQNLWKTKVVIKWIMCHWNDEHWEGTKAALCLSDEAHDTLQPKSSSCTKRTWKHHSLPGAGVAICLKHYEIVRSLCEAWIFDSHSRLINNDMISTSAQPACKGRCERRLWWPSTSSCLSEIDTWRVSWETGGAKKLTALRSFVK